MPTSKKFRVASTVCGPATRQIVYEFVIESVPANKNPRMFYGYEKEAGERIVNALQEAYAQGYLDAATEAAEIGNRIIDADSSGVDRKRRTL